MSGYDNASPYGARSGSYDDDSGGARGGGLTLSPPAVVSMHLSVYPTPVRYVRFDKVHLPRLLPLMLEVLFYRGSKASGATAGGGEASAHASASDAAPVPDEDPFFSYTETPHEVSMVMNRALVHKFARYPFVSIDEEHDWRVVQVCEGSLGFDETGVVQKLAVPLARAGITVAYLSTFLTDFVLIEQNKLLRAIKVLRGGCEVHLECATDLPDEALDPVFQRLRNAAAIPGSPPPGSSSPQPHHAFAPAPQAHGAGVPGAGGTGAGGGAGAGGRGTRSEAGGVALHKHPMVVLPFAVRIAKISKDALQRHMHFLVRLLLLEAGPTSRLVGLTETEDEVSLMLPDAPGLADAVADMVVGSHVWRPMQVGDSAALDFVETGIVATASHVLAQASVTIYYFTTYCTDFTFVTVDDLSTAVAALSDSGMPVSTPPVAPVLRFDPPERGSPWRLRSISRSPRPSTPPSLVSYHNMSPSPSRGASAESMHRTGFSAVDGVAYGSKRSQAGVRGAGEGVGSGDTASGASSGAPVSAGSRSKPHPEPVHSPEPRTPPL